MVTSLSQAQLIQARRFLKNKPGIAPAVRRWAKREGIEIDCRLSPDGAYIACLDRGEITQG